MNPKAREMTPRSANEKGALVPPSRVNAAVTDPAPIKVSRPVPRNSAPSFCTSVGSFSIVYLLPHGSQLIAGHVGVLRARDGCSAVLFSERPPSSYGAVEEKRAALMGASVQTEQRMEPARGLLSGRSKSA